MRTTISRSTELAVFGETLYRERGAAAAQRTLRHADPETTSKMYQHFEASELADDNTAVFDGE